MTLVQHFERCREDCFEQIKFYNKEYIENRMCKEDLDRCIENILTVVSFIEHQIEFFTEE